MKTAIITGASSGIGDNCASGKHPEVLGIATDESQVFACKGAELLATPLHGCSRGIPFA